MHPKELSDQEYYAIATAPTSNEMFDNGAWLAPILSSREPDIDPRAKHAIHFYAEDARLSVCGKRFGPDHYVETFRSNEESRNRCVRCTTILAAVTAGTQKAKVPTVTPARDVYTAAEFTELIQGTTRIQMRVNGMVTIERDLYLLVDTGFIPARSLRRDLKKELPLVDEVVLVWAGESAIARIQAETAERTAKRAAQMKQIEDLQQQLAVMVAPVFAPRTPNELQHEH